MVLNGLAKEPKVEKKLGQFHTPAPAKHSLQARKDAWTVELRNGRKRSPGEAGGRTPDMWRRTFFWFFFFFFSFSFA